MSYYADDDYGDGERKITKRGFAKIDVVDVILSEDTYDSKSRTNLFEQLAESAVKGPNSDSKVAQYAPTYRQEAKKKFDPDTVRRILVDQLEKELRELTYTEHESIIACKRISYNVRKAVKQLNYDRCRIVCQVRITEKMNQGLETRIGFLWDPNRDTFAAHSIETHSFAAYAVVYAVYKE